MNLPFILDVAIGLIFIFLILSLLVSELQELLTTLFQWRAQHLKDAIETLLSGGVGTAEEEHIKELVNKLYDDPLLKNINQEAKGLAGKVRETTRWLIPGNQKGSFGAHRTTGPSYIAPETFATSLLERVGLASLAKKLIEVRLQKFATRIIGVYDVKTEQNEDGTEERIITPLPDGDIRLKELWKKGRIRLIAEREPANLKNLDQRKNFQLLVEEFDDILNDFKTGETNLATSVERMGESFSSYIENYPVPEPKKSQDTEQKTPVDLGQKSDSIVPAELSTDTSAEEIEAVQSEELVYFAKRLRAFRLGMFGVKSERAVASGGLRPSLLEIAELLNQSSSTYQEVTDAYQELRKDGKALDKEVLLALKDELLATHHVEVLEQELVTNHLKQVENQLATLLATKNSKWHEELKDKLTKNSEKCRKAKSDANQPIRCKRKASRRIRSWFVHQWQRRTIPTPEVVQQQRQRIITEMMDRLSEEEQLDLTKAVLKPMDDRQRIITEIMDQLSEEEQLDLTKAVLKPMDDRQRIITEIMDRLSEEEQLDLTKAVLKPMNDKQILGEVEKGYFEMIDHALDRLTNEERHLLIDKALTTILRKKKEWNAEFEKKQRSLYDNYQTYKTTQLILSKLPNSMKESFAILARRAQTRVQHTGNDVNQFREEVAVWFDRSMSRSSGVYKRNAKGIGILIGLFLAIATNVDAAFITDRLSNDENLRTVVTEQALSTSKDTTPEEVRNNTSEALEELALPIGWNPTNFSEQLGCEPLKEPLKESGSMPSLWSQVPSSCLKGELPSANPVEVMIMFAVQYPIALLRILFGWLVAGIAISMGAPFWFDVLGKVMNVRNSGGVPPSTETQATAKTSPPATTVKQ